MVQIGVSAEDGVVESSETLQPPVRRRGGARSRAQKYSVFTALLLAYIIFVFIAYDVWAGTFNAVKVLALSIGGLLIAGAVIGWGKPVSLKQRLRKISPDVVTLIFGIMIMLVWAGIIEAFFSQYHEPVMPYPVDPAVPHADCHQ